MNYKVKNIYGRTGTEKIFVSVPGSKSITARALLISAIADGESVLKGVQYSDDCLTFLNCLKTLGINCTVDGTTVKIIGCGCRLKSKQAEINVGSAGTAARFLLAFLAFQDGEYILDCSEQMKNRPIAPLIKTLKSLGAKFKFFGRENAYPLQIYGTASPVCEAEVDINESSQFLSALLISSVCARRPFKIKIDGSHGFDYVNMTCKMMSDFGARAERAEDCFLVSGGYSANEYEIEPDVSAACYFYAMNKILGTDISVRGITSDSLQGDIKFIEILKNFDGGKINMREFSDQALTLAAVAPFLGRPTQIYGAEHIRKQECDRISAMVSNLTAMGVKCEERSDGVKIYPSNPKPAKINTFGDHRVAMSFALTGLRADGIEIENAEVCSKTFKEYFTVLDEVCGKLTEK